MPLSLAIEVFSVGDILLFFLNDVGTFCKGVITATLFSSSTPKTSLVVLIVPFGLALVGGLLSTRHVSWKKVSRLVLLGVFILFLY